MALILSLSVLVVILVWINEAGVGPGLDEVSELPSVVPITKDQ